MKVLDVCIYYDIIYSLLNPENQINKNNTNFEYILSELEAKDYLGLPINWKKMEMLTCPENKFHLLLDMIDKIGYNEGNIKIIMKNLPMNYDFNNCLWI